MGCGLSQLTRSQRVRVWDISSSSQKSISTSVDMTINNTPLATPALDLNSPSPMSTTGPMEGRKSHALLVDVHHGGHLSSTTTNTNNIDRYHLEDDPTIHTTTMPAKAITQHKPSVNLSLLHERIQTPSAKKEKTSVASTNSAVSAVLAETANSRPKSSLMERGRSSVSVKSFSDHDSGYKDDSQPEEGDDGRVSISPWNEGHMQGGLRQLIPSTISSSGSDSDEPTGNTIIPSRQHRTTISSLMEPTTTTRLTCSQQYGHRLLLDSPPSRRHSLAYSVEPLSMVAGGEQTTLCSCGYSHQKQDGYVETYENGYLDSSYEDLRSLAHEGSVFSIDILCHSAMDGSHRAHKIPLYVHKPTGANQLTGKFQGSHENPNPGSAAAAAHLMSTSFALASSNTHHYHRSANPFDFQYHFHHARAQVNNRPLKTYDARDQRNVNSLHRSSSSVSSVSGAGRRRHISIGSTSGFPTDYMLYQLDNYENLLARRRTTRSVSEKEQTDQANDDEIKSLHD